MEGTPGLWHTILMLPAKLGWPYLSLGVISATLGGVAAFLVLRRSPYPLPAKLLLPFTFYIFYQYSVVSRSYSLLAPLLFAIALAFARKEERTAPYLVLLALLANTTAHGFLVASTLAGMHALGLLRRRKLLPSEVVKRHLFGLGALAVVLLLVGLQLMAGRNSEFIDKQYVFDLRTFRTIPPAVLSQSMVNEPWPTAVVLGASLVWFWRQKTLLLYILPTTVLLIFFSVVYFSIWHEGVLTLIWLFVMWVSFQRAADHSAGRTGDARSVDSWSRLAATAALLGVGVVQLGWSLNAFTYDFDMPYSGSRAAAKFIERNAYDQKKVFGTLFASVALLPYFDRNIYSNVRHGRRTSFWDWSIPQPAIEDPARIVALRPDLVVVSVKSADGEKQYELFPGYRTIACFPGGIAWKQGPIEPDAYLLLEPVSASPVPFEPEPAGHQIGCHAAIAARTTAR